MLVKFGNDRWGGFGIEFHRTVESEQIRYPRKLILDYQIDNINQKMVAAASVMLFPHLFRSTEVEGFNLEAKFIRELMDYFGPSAPRFEKYGPSLDVELGYNTVLIPSDSTSSKLTQSMIGGRQIILRPLDNNVWAGRLFSMDELLVSTNAMGVAKANGSRVEIAKAALGILMAAELRARRIIVELDEELTDTLEEHRIQRLCSSAGVELYFKSSTEFVRLMKSEEA